jgi:biopolymer transport protein ExbB
MLCLLAGWVFTLSGWAQETVVEAGAGEAVETSMSLGEIFKTGGWPMYVLVVMSVVGLSFVLYFFITLRQQQVMPIRFIHKLQEMLDADQLAEARAICDMNKSPIAAVAAAALDYAQRVDHPEPALLKEIIEGEGSRQAVIIQNQNQYLLDIAVIAPMIGLLGTVIGMLRAFNTVALDLAKAKPMLLAAGVSQALITTAAGLIVGIPAMMFFAYFRGRSSKLISGLETASADLLTVLVHKPSE